jgi:hypothetical protein
MFHAPQDMPTSRSAAMLPALSTRTLQADNMLPIRPRGFEIGYWLSTIGYADLRLPALRVENPNELRARDEHLGVVFISINFLTVETSLGEFTVKRIPRPSAYGLASENIFLMAAGSELTIARP